MKKSKSVEKQAPKGSAQARKDALIAKLLTVDNLKDIAGGIGSGGPRPCCKPCD